MSYEGIRNGVFTPWAAVLCLNCHGRGEGYSRLRDEAWEHRNDPLDGPAGGEALTTCDRCGGQVAVRDDVAVENELVKRLKAEGFRAHMGQTGGMCSAAEVDLSENGDDHLLITDNESDALGSAWYLGYYPYAHDPQTAGFGLENELPDAKVVERVRDIVTRYNAGVRDFGGEAW